MSERYIPTADDHRKAEEMMTKDQMDLTMERLKEYGLTDPFGLVAVEKNNDLNFSISEEMRAALAARLAELEPEKLRKVRNMLTPYVPDPTRSGSYSLEHTRKASREWVIFVGEAVEDELMKRGLIRRGL